jgi:catechol 2,3-dioxygenase-like lactoylglutathione lyase family enzyme
MSDQSSLPYGHVQDYTFEHVALNVADKDKAERWYTRYLNMTVARSVPGQKSFLADPTGRVCLELYSNDSAEKLDFDRYHPLALHLAFHVRDVEAAAEDLLNAGATVEEAMKEVSGDQMMMLRDPFGLAIQLVHRRNPMF